MALERLILAFLILLSALRSQEANDTLDPATQNRLMESIFHNVSLEISVLDFNRSLSRNLTFEGTVEKYGRQLLELNKLLNSVFLINAKNYARNYTNQIKEMIVKSLLDPNSLTFPGGKILEFEDLRKMASRLYNLTLSVKALIFLNGTNSESLNETVKYLLGNEITKGVLRYFLGKKRINADFSNKLVNSFDFGKAIGFHWTKIQQETKSVLHILTLHDFINNQSVSHETIEREVVFNVTWKVVETGIREGTILLEFADLIKKNTENERTSTKIPYFNRKFEVFTVLFIGIILSVVLVALGLTCWSIWQQRKKPRIYAKF